MNESACCFIGQNKIPRRQRDEVGRLLTEKITMLIEQGVTDFIFGSVAPFDIFAALVVIELKNIYPCIQITLVLQCNSVIAFRKRKRSAVYKKIEEASDRCLIIGGQYMERAWFRLNRHLINNSGYCICYLTRRLGTARCAVSYAKKQGLKVINVV